MRSLLRRLFLAWAWASLIVALLVLPPPPLSPLSPWLNALMGSWSQQPGDTLIVLAAEEVDGNLLGMHSYWRMVQAVYEWRQGHYRRLVLSGKGLSGPMRQFAISHGVSPEAIVMESQSLTTREQALFVASLAEISAADRIILLTSDFHSRRATLAFRRAGVTVWPRPAADAGKRLSLWWERPGIARDLTMESAKTLYYQWKGWL